MAGMVIVSLKTAPLRLEGNQYPSVCHVFMFCVGVYCQAATMSPDQA